MGIVESYKKGLSTALQGYGVVMCLFFFGLAWNLLNIFAANRLNLANPTPQVSGGLIAAGVVFVLMTVFTQAGSLGFIKTRLKEGRGALGDFFASGGKYYFKILVIALFISMVVGVFVLLAALSASLLGTRSPALSMTLVIFIAAVGVYFTILFFFAPYAAVASDMKAVEALKKSVGLVRQNLLKFVGLAALLVLTGFIAGLILGVVFAGVSLGVKATIPQQIIFAALSSFVNSFLGLFVSSSFMSFYLGLPQSGNTNNT